MNRRIFLAALVITALAAFFFILPRSSRSPGNIVAPAGPGRNLPEGMMLFAKNCMGCHGPGGQGSGIGPPLVHRIYEPNHHADAAFYLAVRRGVRQHHWNFGDMPPLPGVPQEKVRLIVGYVRSLQKKAGIF